MVDVDYVVHNKSSAYSGVIKQFVNLAEETPDFYDAHTRPHEFLARAGGLGDVRIARFPSNILEATREKAAEYEALDMDPETRRTVLVDWVAGTHRLDTADAADLVDNLDEDPGGLDPRVIEDLFDDDLNAMRTAAFDLLEVQEMLKSPATAFLSREDHLETEYETAQRLGFRDVLYIERFPMALVHAGYRRSSDITAVRDAEVRLHEPHRDTGNYTVYAETFTTEALLFLLDPERVAAWSEAWNGTPWPRDDLENHFQAGCRAGMHASSLRDCEEQPGVREDHPHGHAVYTLLHSMSHAALQAASTRSGFAANSLKEHLNMGGLAFAITVNKNYPQSLGGLDALFNRGLDSLFERMEIDTLDCLQDPQCLLGTEGACYACLHLSETSCSAYNSHLDRRFLHGSPATGKTGYWE